jgi:hypothetical protein
MFSISDARTIDLFESVQALHGIGARARMVMFNRARPVRLPFAAHSLFNTAVENVKCKLKSARKAWQARRNASSAV